MFKKFLFRRGILVLGSLLSLTVLLSSCLKDKNEDATPTPVAGLMAFNLVPDQSAVSIGLSGNLLPGSPYAYPGYSGRYLNIFPGSRTVESINGLSGQALDSLSYTFEPNKYYSLFVLGSNGNYQNVISVDNVDSLTASAGKAYVRFVNGLSNAASSNVTISSGGTNVVNSSAPFGQVSSFVAVNPGDLSINVSNEGAVNSSRTIAVAQQKAYTILLTGLPNQADTTKNVSIRFIENGTVTN